MSCIFPFKIGNLWVLGWLFRPKLQKCPPWDMTPDRCFWPGGGGQGMPSLDFHLGLYLCQLTVRRGLWIHFRGKSFLLCHFCGRGNRFSCWQRRWITDTNLVWPGIAFYWEVAEGLAGLHSIRSNWIGPRDIWSIGGGHCRLGYHVLWGYTA